MFAEFIPVERANEARQGIKRLVQDCCPVRSFAALVQNGASSADDFFDKFVSEAWGMLSTTRLAAIDTPVDSEVAKVASFIEIVGIRISSTLAVLRFEVNLTQEFSAVVKEILDNHYQDESVLRFEIKRVHQFRGWGTRSVSAEHRKGAELRAAIDHCRSLVLAFINKYIPFHFWDRQMLVPTIEFYGVSRSSTLRTNQDRPNHFNLFWESIGMRMWGTFHHDISDDGQIELFSDELDKRGTLKVLFNNTSDEYVRQVMEYYCSKVLVLLTVFWYLRQVSARIQRLRSELFGITGKGVRMFSRALSKTVRIQEEAQLFSRVRAEVTKESLQSLSQFLRDEVFGHMHPVGAPKIRRTSNTVTSLPNDIVYHIETLANEINLTRNIFTETTELLATRSTMRGQWITIALTILTAILTGITIYVTEHPAK